MIVSAEEFVALRTSERPEEYLRAAHDTASNELWFEVIHRFPNMRIWVAHNRTVPVEVLAVLAHDPDADVRESVAMKNKLSGELFALLAADRDEFVRQRIACNKKTPLDILKRLAQDSSKTVSSYSRRRLRSLD